MEPEAFLAVDIPVEDICWLSHLPASALATLRQCWKKGDPEIFPESTLGFNKDTKEQQPELTTKAKLNVQSWFSRPP